MTSNSSRFQGKTVLRCKVKPVRPWPKLWPDDKLPPRMTCKQLKLFQKRSQTHWPWLSEFQIVSGIECKVESSTGFQFDREKCLQPRWRFHKPWFRWHSEISNRESWESTAWLRNNKERKLSNSCRWRWEEWQKRTCTAQQESFQTQTQLPVLSTVKIVLFYRLSIWKCFGQNSISSKQLREETASWNHKSPVAIWWPDFCTRKRNQRGWSKQCQQEIEADGSHQTSPRRLESRE